MAGYSFCGLAALMFLKKGRLCNIDTLLKWAANRQMRVEGGFQVSVLFLRQLSHHIFDELAQSPFIRNGLIRNGVKFWGKYKKRALGRSNLRNASKNLRNAERSDFQSLETSNIFHLYLI